LSLLDAIKLLEERCSFRAGSTVLDIRWQGGHNVQGRTGVPGSGDYAIDGSAAMLFHAKRLGGSLNSMDSFPARRDTGIHA
jgi:hypothetical protein